MGDAETEIRVLQPKAQMRTKFTKLFHPACCLLTAALLQLGCQRMAIKNTALSPLPVHCQVLPWVSLRGTAMSGPMKAQGKVPKWLPLFSVKILDHPGF